MTMKKRSNGIFFIKFFDVVQGQTRRVSTGVRNKQLTQKFVRKLKLEQENNSKVKPITLSKFKQIYLEYTAPTYSKNYIKSIKLSFRKLEAFIKKNLAVDKITVQLLYQFMAESYHQLIYHPCSLFVNKGK